MSGALALRRICAAVLVAGLGLGPFDVGRAQDHDSEQDSPAAPAAAIPAQRAPAKKKPAAPRPSPKQTAAEKPAAASVASPAPANGPSAAQAAPAAPKTLAETPVGDIQPVTHARNAKVTTCMDNLVSQSAQTIDRPHQAISTWVTEAPNENLFSSVVGLTYTNPLTPNGLAVLLAAPVGPARCEGQSVQVYPTSQDCLKVQANLLRGGRTVANLGALPVVQSANGRRDILMPTAGNGCVVVSVRLN